MKLISEMVSIRTFEKDDIDGVMRIEAMSFPHPWTPNMFDALRLIDPDGCLVAQMEGEIAGYAMVLYRHDFGHWRGERGAHLLNIAVDPAHRNKGIGSELIKTVAKRTHLAGLPLIHLEVRISNTGAIAFYSGRGFATISRLKGFYEHEDALVMVKKIS